MKLSKIITGFTLLAPYTKSEYCVDAEHDILYFSIDSPPSAEDRAKLEDLGWFVDENTDGGEGTSWACFT